MEYQICYRRHHLNNILTTITDRRIGVYDVLTGQFDHYEPEQYDTREYYAFGSESRRGSNPWTVIVNSKQGFNNKEKSHKTNSQINYDYGFRIYNAGFGKFLRVDPLTSSYPELTPYQFASNRPIDGVDLDGLEYLSINHPAFANKTRTGHGFFNFLSGCNQKPTAGEILRKAYESSYSKITIAGSQYYDVGRHLYYDGSNLNSTGTRRQQATEASQVGLTLIHEFNNLNENSVLNLSYNDDSKKNIENTRNEALKYKNCFGVCWAVTQARINNAYKGIFDLSINNKNIIHLLSAVIERNKNNSAGAGDALMHMGLGSQVSNVWDGSLQTGAILQISKSNGGGHSQIFRRYIYSQDNGEIIGIDAIDNNNETQYTDQTTGNFIDRNTSDFIIGVNLKDKK